MGHKAKWEYFRECMSAITRREAKQMMLNEFCLNTGYHRKYAIRLLNGTTFIFPTASNSQLGQNKWQIGPAGVFGYLAVRG